MIVYGTTLSPYVRKVIVFAAEKGMDLILEPVGLGSQDPGFLEASPFRKMPAFRDGDFTVSDSSAIVHYLEAKQPAPALIPAEPKARARSIWYEEFADTIFVSCGAKMFFNRIVSPYFIGRPGNPDAADKAEREELPPILDYLESVVPDAGGFLVGDALSLADIAVASPFANLRLMDVAVDPNRHPRTRAYADSILARPSFAPLLARERAFLTQAVAAAGAS